jgi:hypothetical protein
MAKAVAGEPKVIVRFVVKTTEVGHRNDQNPARSKNPIELGQRSEGICKVL